MKIFAASPRSGFSTEFPAPFAKFAFGENFAPEALVPRVHLGLPRSGCLPFCEDQSAALRKGTAAAKRASGFSSGMKCPQSTSAPERFWVQAFHRLSGAPVVAGNPNFDQMKRSGAVIFAPRVLSARSNRLSIDAPAR